MRRFCWLIFFLACHVFAAAQVTELAKIGQTPGGSAFHVHYDAAREQLFVGCGVSVMVFDASDPDQLVQVARRPLQSLVNETLVYGDTLFAAASNDGLWALDLSSPTLDPIAHYPTPGDTGAYDIWRTNDTLYLANGFEAVLLTFDGQTGFTEHLRFGTPDIAGLAGKGRWLATGRRNLTNGTVDVYDRGNLATLAASFTTGHFLRIEDLAFSERTDSLLYVCGGGDLFYTNSRFYAMEFTGSALTPLDTIRVTGAAQAGIPAIANMDERNDTLFLATTAATIGLETTVPVYDAGNLPGDSLRHLADLYPGNWNFDVAVMGAHNRLAVASEWYGVLVHDFSAMGRYDTTGTFDTGGWGLRSRLRGDTLWACLEGYGVAAYKIADLSPAAGFQPQPAILHFDRAFGTDLTFVDDTLLVIAAKSQGYRYLSIADWLGGGAEREIRQFRPFGRQVFAGTAIVTNVGPRVVGGSVALLTGGNGRLELFDPYDPNPSVLQTEILVEKPNEILVNGDSLWVGGRFGGVQGIAGYRVENDAFQLLDTGATPGVVERVAKEGALLAAACGPDGIRLFRQSGGNITAIGEIATGQDFTDVAFKNGLLYAAERYEGAYVYDISTPATPVAVAHAAGSGSWFGLPFYGSLGIEIGDGGGIYLSDFHGGVYLYEAFDTTLTATMSPVSHIDMEIYPNPAADRVRIRVSGADPGGGVLRILDTYGRKMREIEMKSREIELDVSRFHQGIYFVVYQSNSMLEVRRMVVVK